MAPKCFFCQAPKGPESIEIYHKGDLVGYICDNCQRGPLGFKLLLKLVDGEFVPVQAVPLSSVRE